MSFKEFLYKIKKYISNPWKIIIDFCHIKNFKYAHLISDKLYIKCLYRDRIGKKLNLKNPQTMNEKLQWLKLYDRKPEYTDLVDKLKVKEIVAEKIGEEYIIPTLGVWGNADDIDFDALPDQFVLKCSHDSASIEICKDKEGFDFEGAKRRLNEHLKINHFWSAREWPYKYIKPRIIAEEYLNNSEINGLRDYKFYCFNGKPRFLYISEGLVDHSTAKISFVENDWRLSPFQRLDYEHFDYLPEKPKNFDNMISLSEVLSDHIPFVRVDMYNVNGIIYFSEFTFYPCSGMMPFSPLEWDETIGSWLELPEMKKR